jgi:hypothetical protein
MAFRPNIDVILSTMENKGYTVFRNPTGHDLNLIGIRTADPTANRFNDWLTVSYRFEDNWNFFAFPATTDPGTFYRQHPLNVRGTAILKPGQYRGAYRVGLHRGYKALQQKGPLTVYRDADLDEEIDTTGNVEDTGIHGINIHRADAYRVTTDVGKWSAGCQVLQDPDHFAFLLALCERGREKFGNSFTYTLLNEEDIQG